MSFLQSPSTKITLKVALIFILVLFLMIPKFKIMDLVNERKELNLTVMDDVYSGWGNEQIIAGPVLVIPYHEMVSQSDITKPKVQVKKNLLIYPDSSKTDGKLSTESKYRSLYKVLLYKANLNFQGNFVIPKYDALNINQDDMLYNEAYVTIGITDPKGIENKIDFKWSDEKFSFSPGLVDVQFQCDQNHESQSRIAYTNSQGIYVPGFKTGLHSKIPVSSENDEYRFSFNLDFKGSKSLQFAPLGRYTDVQLKSVFPDPVFNGGFLPEHATNSDGFDAKWKILEYNKTLPPFQKDVQMVDLGNNLFGVKIQHLTDNYTTTNRAVKYMILIIALTFLVVFLTEIVERIHIHIFQYTLIGLALAIFFTLLLSISEFWGFDLAYSGSATATIGLIFLYSLGMFKNKKSSGLLLGLMVALFAYIYIIIQLEKTALLAGSIGLFVIIALTMYVTRKIRWFEESRKQDSRNIESTEIN